MGRRRQTHCGAGHPLEGNNLIENSRGKRQCRACKNFGQRQRRGTRAASRTSPSPSSKHPSGLVKTGVPGWGAV